MDLRIRKTKKNGYSYTLKFNDDIFKRNGFMDRKSAFNDANLVITKMLVDDINTNNIIQEAMADVIQEELNNSDQ